VRREFKWSGRDNHEILEIKWCDYFGCWDTNLW